MTRKANKVPTVKDLSKRARRTGVALVELCRRADISYSTWKRWETGECAPRIDTMTRMDGVIAKIEANEQRRKKRSK